MPLRAARSRVCGPLERRRNRALSWGGGGGAAGAETEDSRRHAGSSRKIGAARASGGPVRARPGCACPTSPQDPGGKWRTSSGRVRSPPGGARGRRRARGSLAAEGGHVRAAGHDHEAEHSHHDQLRGHPGEEDAESHHREHDPQHDVAHGAPPPHRLGVHAGCEAGVVFVQLLLELGEKLLFVLGERHDSSCGVERVRRWPWDRPSRTVQNIPWRGVWHRGIHQFRWTHDPRPEPVVHPVHGLLCRSPLPLAAVQAELEGVAGSHELLGPDTYQPHRLRRGPSASSRPAASV